MPARDQGAKKCANLNVAPPQDLDGLLDETYAASRRIENLRQNSSMAIRAKFAAIVGTLLGSLVVLFGSAAPSSAHPGHHHGPAAVPASHAAVHAPVVAQIVTSCFATIVETGEGQPKINDIDQTVLTAAPAKAPLPLHPSNCCCGSIACHSGVADTIPALLPRETYSARVQLAPVLATAGAIMGGIERPPRRSAPL